MNDVALISASSGLVPEYNSSNTQKCVSDVSLIESKIVLHLLASA